MWSPHIHTSTCIILHCVDMVDGWLNIEGKSNKQSHTNAPSRLMCVWAVASILSMAAAPREWHTHTRNRILPFGSRGLVEFVSCAMAERRFGHGNHIYSWNWLCFVESYPIVQGGKGIYIYILYMVGYVVNVSLFQTNCFVLYNI